MAETDAERSAREALNDALLRRIPALLTQAYGATARRDWAGLEETLRALRHEVAACEMRALAALHGEEGRRDG